MIDDAGSSARLAAIPRSLAASARHGGQTLVCPASTLGETPNQGFVPTRSSATVAGETLSPNVDTPSGAQVDRDYLSGKVGIFARLTLAPETAGSPAKHRWTPRLDRVPR